ncbi:serine carboxypeptidase-like [Tripterygium wilfordii]|uniref:serine carboxypeptidase-like n=1 Tax=Tripterygium wilfordii TaxID=458696 RepID=UPI0018F86393|nr:serine carboxypeptidase-like [Tripterygium wilfordii]
MSSICSLLFLYLFLLDLFFTSSLGFPDHHFGSSETDLSSEEQAERLERLIDFYRKDDVNIFKGSSSININDSRRVGKKSPLPAGSGPYIEFLGNHVGSYPIKSSISARMFYFFFESRGNKNDPVVIWLGGWPGCSSDLSLFYGNGPFHVGKGLSLKWNHFGWNKVSNIIFVDQPTGTGFSSSPDVRDIRHNETGVSNDLYNFLQKFFDEHPTLKENEFFITGESYGGHYIPALASRIHQGNKANEGIHINLKGFAIGNGFTNLDIQLPATIEYALDKTLIEKKEQHKIWEMIQKCKSSIEKCSLSGDKSNCFKIIINCGGVVHKILEIAGNINFFNIAKTCVGKYCYDFTSVEKLLKDQLVKEALHVGVQFAACNPTVFMAMLGDWFENLDVGIPDLLKDGIRVLIYVGEQDLICNWVGNKRWVHEMKWYGKENFAKTPMSNYFVDGKKVGKVKNYGPLSLLKVFKAGHMVPMDRPKVALHMIKNWMEENFP